MPVSLSRTMPVMLPAFVALAQFVSSPPDRSSISGRVMDPSGRPVSDAAVTLTGPAARQERTGTDGRFAFDALPAGSYQLTVKDVGFLDGRFGRQRPDGPGAPLTLNADQRIDNADVRLWQYATLSGTVFDESGDPVVSAEVRAVRAVWTNGRPGFEAVKGALTNDSGAYRIGGLMPGRYVVLVPFRRATAPLAIQSPNGTTHPVTSADVVQSSATTATRQSNGLLIEMSSASASTPAHARAYRTTYWPEAPDLGGGMPIELASGDERGGVDFHLQLVDAWTVSGTLANADGSPVIPTELRLVPVEGDQITPLTDSRMDTGPTVLGREAAFDPALDLSEFALSPADGHYAFGAVPAGHYELGVLYTPDPWIGSKPRDQQLSSIMAINGFRGDWVRSQRKGPPEEPTRVARQEVVVGDGDVTLNVTLNLAAHVSGTIAFQGSTPPPDSKTATQKVGILQEPANGGSLGTLSSYVASDWTFTTYGAPPGRYFLGAEIDAPGWFLKSIVVAGKDVMAVPFDLGATDVTGVIVTFADHPQMSTISGRVTRDGSAPDDDTTVIAVPSDPREWVDSVPMTRFVRSSETGPHGEYQVDNVPPGDYLVAAVPEAVAARAATQAAAFFTDVISRATPVHVATGSVAIDLRTIRVPGR